MDKIKNSMTGSVILKDEPVVLVVHNPPESKEPKDPNVTEKKHG
jgi:hypothetical protein